MYMFRSVDVLRKFLEGTKILHWVFIYPFSLGLNPIIHLACSKCIFSPQAIILHMTHLIYIEYFKFFPSPLKNWSHQNCTKIFKNNNNRENLQGCKDINLFEKGGKSYGLRFSKRLQPFLNALNILHRGLCILLYTLLQLLIEKYNKEVENDMDTHHFFMMEIVSMYGKMQNN